jgi:tRNA A-37 threonylcarbamoyl transferase component Bud32
VPLVVLDIADGMRFLHDSNIIHRDLKSANILLDRDGRCKIDSTQRPRMSHAGDHTVSQTP